MHFVISPAGSKLPPTSRSTKATNTKETGPLLDDEEAIQGILTNVMEEKVTIRKYTRETLARKVKFVSPWDMEHNGRMSLKVKK
jgi:hypothetical protein